MSTIGTPHFFLFLNTSFWVQQICICTMIKNTSTYLSEKMQKKFLGVFCHSREGRRLWNQRKSTYLLIFQLAYLKIIYWIFFLLKDLSFHFRNRPLKIKKLTIFDNFSSVLINQQEKPHIGKIDLPLRFVNSHCWHCV
jgi:hypothetical protein